MKILFSQRHIFCVRLSLVVQCKNVKVSSVKMYTNPLSSVLFKSSNKDLYIQGSSNEIINE